MKNRVQESKITKYIFSNHKTNTSFRIGISIAMIIMMLGLTLFLNSFTTYVITDQTRILSDLSTPISKGIIQTYEIQQLQNQNFENSIAYMNLDSQENYKISKNQFETYNNEWNYEIKKITESIDTFSNQELTDEVSTHLDILAKNLNEIKKIHVQYGQKVMQIFDDYDKNQKNDLNKLVSSARADQDQMNLRAAILNDDDQKLVDSLITVVDENKQKSFTLEVIITASAGIMSLSLGYFLNIINRDLAREVIRKTRSLQKANKRLEKMNKLKDDFINKASHELKSPLHPIYGFLELAQSGDIGKEEALTGILKQVNQLEEVANRILDISRIDNGMLQLSYERFDLKSMVSDMVSSYKLNLSNEIKIQVDAMGELVIEADRIRIGQVIRNLINNALKFTSHGIIHIIIIYDLEKNFVEFSISDNGPGIHQDILPKLFNKFTTRGPETEPLKGNGLGLYLSREIINKHGGHIFAYNNRESGATFKFTIPIIKHQKLRELHQKIMN
ncbi:MAG: HAMP domain-containing sensor histidine kinase [Nitrososphaera sp.]|jgi:signal transduction histidine kinase